MRWDEFPDIPPEKTYLTPGAHEYARARARDRFENPRFATDDTELRILPPSEQYLAVVFGQPAATGGKQGANPQRFELLRNLDLDVWIAFVAGHGKPDATTVWSGWLRLLPPAVPISRMTGAKRFGWSVAKGDTPLTTSRSLDFPEAIPSTPALAEGLF